MPSFRHFGFQVQRSPPSARLSGQTEYTLFFCPHLDLTRPSFPLLPPPSPKERSGKKGLCVSSRRSCSQRHQPDTVHLRQASRTKFEQPQPSMEHYSPLRWEHIPRRDACRDTLCLNMMKSSQFLALENDTTTQTFNPILIPYYNPKRNEKREREIDATVPQVTKEPSEERHHEEIRR